MFPVTGFRAVSPSESSLQRHLDHEKALLIVARFSGIRLKDIFWGCPYIPIAKSTRIRGGVYDNGRVLEAEALTITLTDIDYLIIAGEYVWDKMDIEYLYSASYGRLPRPLIDVTIGYYRRKTELKDVAGQEVYYTKEKNKLNSIYGMSAQDPVKPRVVDRNLEYVVMEDYPEKLLEESYKNQFMPYQWGVWITAWARYRLEEGLRLAGESYVYCDTDCVKSIGEIDFTAYNKIRVDSSIRNGAYADDSSGHRHYMGVFETEKTMDRFITWGAKKYCGEVGGKLSVTVSGVRRGISATELERMGGIEAFHPGMIFVDAGGVEISYRDHHPYKAIVDGREIIIPSCANIKPSTYTLGITSEYDNLLSNLPGFEDI